MSNTFRGSRLVAAGLIAACTAISATVATATMATASTVAHASASARASTHATASSSALRGQSLAQIAMLEQRAKWASHARPGQQGVITGRVAGINGQPVTGACVTAVSGGRSITTAVAPDGTFRLAGLPAGSYALEYRGCTAASRALSSSSGYLATWYGGTGSQSTAARVRVAAGQVRHVPGVTLRPVNAEAAIAAGQASFRRELAANSRTLSAAATAKTGRISGKVTGKGKPLSGICVLVTSNSAPQAYGAQTSKHGTYAIRDVIPGRYYVIFAPTGVCSDRANWLQQIYKNDNNPYGSGTAVRVRAGHDTAGINANLRLGGEISGTVTSRSGAKLRGICVFTEVNTGHGEYLSYQEQTDASGKYYLHALFPGKYSLYFEIGCGSGSENYAPATHAPVAIRLGQDRTVDQVLAAGASITGKVTLTTSSGKPLSGICVETSNYSGTVNAYGSTGRKGNYRLIGLTGGRFEVAFSPCINGNYTSVFLTARTTAGHQTSNVNAVLQAGATISGTITDTHNNPVSNICIEVVSNNSQNANVEGDNGGSYVINQLSAGTYQVGFYSGCGNSGNYAPNWYYNQADESTATPITVATGATDSTVNAVLQPGATITGKVTDTHGNGLSGVCVTATSQPYGALVAQPAAQAGTGRNGTYTLADLEPGQYLINFGCGSGRYGDQWFPGAPDPATAELVSVPAGRTPNINATLHPGGTIKGVVTGKGGHPLSGVCVFAFNTKGGTATAAGTSVLSVIGGASQLVLTGPRGGYQISGMAAGRYQVLFTPCISSPRYAAQWYRGKASQLTATDVTVRAGKTTPGISGRLVIGGMISGQVTNSEHKPVRNICVFAVSQSAGLVGVAFTGKAGTYTIVGVATGRYTVQFSPCDNQNLITAVAQARVTAPHATKGVNATMQPGGSIAGVVTTAAGSPPAPVSGACVEIYSGNSAAPVESVLTGVDGSYLATGLPAGSYEVHFGDPQCLAAPGLAPQWYPGQSTRATAQQVSVTVGHTSPPIDAALLADGAISGTVSAGSPASPLSGACVTAFPLAANGSLPIVGVTGTTGYTLPQLVPGQYKVRFSAGCGAAGYATQWYNGVTSRTAAQTVNVVATQTTPAISGTLNKSS